MHSGNQSGNSPADQIAALFDVDERAREEQKVVERIRDYTRKITECEEQGKYPEAKRFEQERAHVIKIHDFYNTE